MEEFWKDRPQRLKEGKVLQVSLGASVCQYLLTGRKKKEKREGGKEETNGATSYSFSTNH